LTAEDTEKIHAEINNKNEEWRRFLNKKTSTSSALQKFLDRKTKNDSINRKSPFRVRRKKHAKQSCRHHLLDGEVPGKNTRNAADDANQLYFLSGGYK